MAIKVLIPECITSMNKGEAAIFEGIREGLSENGSYLFTLFSVPNWIQLDRVYYSNMCRVVSGMDLYQFAKAYTVGFNKISPKEFYSNWLKLIFFAIKLRIVGRLCKAPLGDDLLAAFMENDVILAGHNGFLSHLQFYLVLAGRIMKKPVALFGGGNDLQGRSKFWVRVMFRYAVKHSMLCVVRDAGSREYLLLNGVPAEKVHLAPDPAVLLKPAPRERVDEILKAEGIPSAPEVELYGLVPVYRTSIVFGKSFIEETDLEMKYKLRVDFWVDIVTHLLDTVNAHFIFLPHCIGPTESNDDRCMAIDIMERLHLHRNRITNIQTEYSASDLKGLIKRCSYIVGERTHALIGAMSVGTPFMAISVEEDLRMHKIIGELFGEMVYNLNKPDADELKVLLDNGWIDRDQTRHKLQEKGIHIHNEARKASAQLDGAIRKTIEIDYTNEK